MKAEAPGWQAELELEFFRRDTGACAGSYLGSRRQRGPLTLQKVLYPEGAHPAHAILLHPPGGIAGGDRLDIRIHCREGAQVLTTTPGASKWYRSAGRAAEQRVSLRVDAGAGLEWLPQENIVFDGARASSHTRVVLEQQARFVGWDVLCLGRPVGDAPFECGEYRQSWSIERHDRLLWWEAGRIGGADPLMQSPVGLHGYTVAATLVAIGAQADDALLASLRALAIDGVAGVTLTPRGVLLIRCLARQAEIARAYLTLAWALLRPVYLERDACVPRIW